MSLAKKTVVKKADNAHLYLFMILFVFISAMILILERIGFISGICNFIFVNSSSETMTSIPLTFSIAGLFLLFALILARKAGNLAGLGKAIHIDHLKFLDEEFNRDHWIEIHNPSFFEARLYAFFLFNNKLIFFFCPEFIIKYEEDSEIEGQRCMIKPWHGRGDRYVIQVKFGSDWNFKSHVLPIGKSESASEA